SRGRARRAGEGAAVQAAQPAGAQPARAVAVQARLAVAGGGDLPLAHRGPYGGSDAAREPRARLPETECVGGRGALLRDGARPRSRAPEGAELSRPRARAERGAGARAGVVP